MPEKSSFSASWLQVKCATSVNFKTVSRQLLLLAMCFVQIPETKEACKTVK